MATEDDKLEIVPDRAVEVRETRTLFRLAPAAASDLSRSNLQVAIVAADTEDEARQIAFTHDVFGRDWRDPHYAVCESSETTETHVFGDVIFRSEPVAVEGRKRGEAQQSFFALRGAAAFGSPRRHAPLHRRRLMKGCLRA